VLPNLVQTIVQTNHDYEKCEGHGGYIDWPTKNNTPCIDNKYLAQMISYVPEPVEYFQGET